MDARSIIGVRTGIRISAHIWCAMEPVNIWVTNVVNHLFVPTVATQLIVEVAEVNKFCSQTLASTIVR